MMEPFDKYVSVFVTQSDVIFKLCNFIQWKKYNTTNQTNESARLSKNIYVHEKTLEVR